LSDLADYVSVDAGHEGVVGAEVRLATPLLSDMCLMDTPGVGGLRHGHSAVTMSTLQGAHALLFVMDASAPLSRPELDFLADAAERNDAVVLVMTKTDLYPEWTKIRDDDQALIARQVPRLAGVPILPMSSRLAEQASRLAERPEAAEQVMHLSGLDNVVGQLRATVTNSRAGLALARNAAVLHGLLVELRARLSEEPAHVVGNPGEMAALIVERDRIQSFLTDPHHGALRVHKRMARIRRDAEQLFVLKAESLCQRYAASLDSFSGGELKQVPALLRGELAQLVADSIDEVDREIFDILYELEHRIGSAVVLDRLRGLLQQQAEAAIGDHLEAGNWGTHLTAASEKTIGLAGSVIFAGVLSWGAALIAVAAAGLATIGVKEVLSSRTSSRQQSLRLWIDRVQRDVGRSFERALGGRLDELERIMSSELPRLFQDRVARIEALTTLTGVPSGPPAAVTLADVDDLISKVSSLLEPAR